VDQNRRLRCVVRRRLLGHIRRIDSNIVLPQPTARDVRPERRHVPAFDAAHLEPQPLRCIERLAPAGVICVVSLVPCLDDRGVRVAHLDRQHRQLVGWWPLGCLRWEAPQDVTDSAYASRQPSRHGPLELDDPRFEVRGVPQPAPTARGSPWPTRGRSRRAGAQQLDERRRRLRCGVRQYSVRAASNAPIVMEGGRFDPADRAYDMTERSEQS
jgi:hypothetical protein